MHEDVESPVKTEYRLQSNCDIDNVLANKTQTLMLMNDLGTGKNVTITEFKMKPLPIFKGEDEVKEFNKSALLLKTDSKQKNRSPVDTFCLP